MNTRFHRYLAALCLLSLYACSGFAEDLFSNHKPVEIAPLQKVAAGQTLGGYPILNLGNELVIAQLQTINAGGLTTSLPIGVGAFIDARDNAFFASIVMEGNLVQSGEAADWTDEPCKKDDFLWKRSVGRNFSNINCATIAPITEFSQQYPTVIRVRFTRYASTARRLGYIVNINPEMFGIERDAEPNLQANSWNKSRVQNDPKKVEFLSRLQKWTEDVQNKMDDAFDKKTEAFSGISPLMTYF